MIRVVFFASIREALDTASVELEITTPADIDSVIQALGQRGPMWLETLQQENILVAVNQTMTDQTFMLEDGDELAFFPPVTGG